MRMKERRQKTTDPECPPPMAKLLRTIAQEEAEACRHRKCDKQHNQQQLINVDLHGKQAARCGGSKNMKPSTWLAT